MPDGARPEARIDADEQHIESRRDHVGNALAAGPLEVGARWRPGNPLHHRGVSASMGVLRLVLATAVWLTACASPAPAVESSGPSSPTPSVRTDRAGDVLKPPVDDATWGRHDAHPLTPPPLPAGGWPLRE